MKKYLHFIGLLLLGCLFTQGVQASDIVIQAQSIAWTGPTSDVEIRFFLVGDGSTTVLRTPENQMIRTGTPASGTTTYKWDCTFPGSGQLGLPAITLPATTNAVGGGRIRWSAVFFRKTPGTAIQPYANFTFFELPHYLPAPVTWFAVQNFNATLGTEADLTKPYGRGETEARIAAAIAASNPGADPVQGGQAGKYLFTDGTSKAWRYLGEGGTIFDQYLPTTLAGKTLPTATLIAPTITGGANVTGTITATAFVGNGAGLTGIGATGGVVNPGSTTVGADSDSDDSGVVALQTRGITRLQVENDGAITIPGAQTVGGALSVTGVVSGATPSAAGHLTTKAYVDAAVASGTTPDATTATKGKALLALQADIEAADTAKIVTPSLLKLNRMGILAAAQSGAGDTAKMDAALAAGASSGLPVWLDRQLASATSAPTTLTANVGVWDTRGGGGWDYVGVFGSSYASGWSFSRKATTAPVAPANPSLVHFFQHAQQGGRNSYTPPSTYDKVNWMGIDFHQLVQTPGQTIGYTMSQFKTSKGDLQAVVVATRYNSTTDTNGDEGVKSFNGSTQQIAAQFTGTVAAIDGGGVMTYSGAANTYARGERQHLINLSTGIYTTGTITGIAGTPPVVTGSGTTWTSLGTGAVTGLYFITDADTTTYGRKHVFRVRSITDDTHLVLDTQGIGTDLPFPNGTQSGTYKIYRGSEITLIADNSVTLATPASFSAGNLFEQPIAPLAVYTGISVSSEMFLPHASAVGISVNNGNSPVVPLNYGILLNGKITDAIRVNDPMTNGLILGGTVSGAALDLAFFPGATATTNLIRLLDGGGFTKSLSFTRTSSAPYGYLTLGGTWGITSTGEAGFGTIPAAGTKMTIQGASSDLPLYIEHSNASVDALANFQYTGIPAFSVRRTRSFLNNGAYLEGFSDNQSTRTWKIFSTGGVGDFTSLRLGAGSGAGVTWTRGTGSPEGAVTAVAGSLYSDLNGGAGVTFWVKESGSGNTGWIAK